jgi:hypothetical protein
LTIVIPLILASVVVGLRVGDLPQYTPDAYCGNDSSPVVFFIVYVVSLWMCAIPGSICTSEFFSRHFVLNCTFLFDLTETILILILVLLFLIVWAVIAYTQRRKRILKTLSQFSQNKNDSTNSNSADPNSRFGTESTASTISSVSSSSSTAKNNITSPSGTTKSTATSSTPKSSQNMNANNTNTDSVRRRMIIWSVGYHLLSTAYLVQSTMASIKSLQSLSRSSSSSSSSSTIYDLGSTVANETLSIANSTLGFSYNANTTIISSSNSTASASARSSDRDSRAATVIYATVALSVLLFLCFGWGAVAMERYCSIFPFLRRFKRTAAKNGFNVAKRGKAQEKQGVEVNGDEEKGGAGGILGFVAGLLKVRVCTVRYPLSITMRRLDIIGLDELFSSLLIDMF